MLVHLTDSPFHSPLLQSPLVRQAISSTPRNIDRPRRLRSSASSPVPRYSSDTFSTSGRAIGQEDRDGYRLKDKLGRTILCYKCGSSASLPQQRKIISCDFCDQHWHLDCLDPPMTGMPPPTRKWMCPVHSDHVLVRSPSSLLEHRLTRLDSRRSASRSRRLPSPSTTSTFATTATSSSLLSGSLEKLRARTLRRSPSTAFDTRCPRRRSFSTSGDVYTRDPSA
mgnify:FL=1